MYSEILTHLGARSYGYVVMGEVDKFFDWLHGELSGLTEVINISGDYCARISAQGLLETLSSEG